jgi:thiol-disulfide isomerase/thioredoxin
MKTKLFPFFLLLSGLIWLTSPACAQEQKSVTPAAELGALIARIQTKLRAGQKSVADLAPETADFAALRAKYAESLPAEAAKIAQREYSYYSEVLKDDARASAVRKELETRYKKFLAGTALAQELAMADARAKAKASQEAAVGKRAPELNFEWANRKGLAKLSNLRGKVVVLDFWATWCGPCIATFPQIRELAEHYKDADVVIVGVTSIQGFVAGLEPARIVTRNDPEREYALTANFIKAKNMTWTVAFSEQRVFNPDYGVIGIPHMAIIAPDGTLRHNGLHPGMPHAEKLAKIDALLKEFGKMPKAASGQ